MVIKTIQDEMKESVLEAQIVKYDADDTAPVYIGVNNVADASDDADDWRLYKFYYVGVGVVKIIKKTGSWTLRSSYFP